MDETNETGSVPENITVALSKLQAAATVGALQLYAKHLRENTGQRLFMSLRLGEDPVEVAREAARVIDVAGSAAFGGTPYTDAEFYGEEPDAEPEPA